MLKQQRGITLITLVITIVILIILAGVAISLSLSNNGLFSKTKEAKSAYLNAEANEQNAMNALIDSINSYLE
jgi:Tfp pilus assembly protein PilE